MSGMRSFVFHGQDMSLEQAQSIWSSLKRGIREIQQGNASKLRFEELYRNAYTLVLHKYGDLLYDGVKQTIAEQLHDVNKIVSQAAPETLMSTLVDVWERHRLVMNMIKDILMYLDKTHCTRARLPFVYQMGLELFRDLVLQKDGISHKLQTVLLQQIQKERRSETIERTQIKSALQMLVEVNTSSKAVYQKEFEVPFLLETKLHYEAETQYFLSNSTVPDYLKKQETRLSEEEDRANAYLDESTRRKLLNVVEYETIQKFAEELVKNPTSGAIPMFEKQSIEDLTRMYRLFSRIPETLDILREEMKRHVTLKGSAIVQDDQNKKDPNKFVQDLLDLRSIYFMIVDRAFSEDRKFARSLKEAFEEFINLDARTAQYLSLYVDDLLKKGLLGLSEDVAEQKLDQAITIFRYLNDKDVFEEFYKKNLASRLLHGKGTSDDLERLMISKLKAECGHQFTSKLEGMFKNIELSKEINVKFAKHLTSLEAANPDLPDLSVHVLTTGFWPYPATEPCVLPSILTPRIQQFESFYTSMQAGHRLTWQTSLGSAQLFCLFKQGLKEIEVQTYQMCIMMLYNEKDSFQFSEIQERTQIPPKELERHILSLAHPKVGILKKKPNVKKVSPTDIFSYNMDFTSKQYRIKVRLLALSTEVEPEAAVPETVMEARKNLVDAAIVRIMKTRQRLEHSSLLSEVGKQLSVRFPADPVFVKKRIETLIEREYLERDKDDRRFYNYLA